MVKDFLLGKTKVHKRHCKYEYKIQVRTSVVLFTVFFSMLAVYLIEQYWMQIPWWLAVVFVVVMAGYLIHNFFEIALLYKQDEC